MKAVKKAMLGVGIALMFGGALASDVDAVLGAVFFFTGLWMFVAALLVKTQHSPYL